MVVVTGPEMLLTRVQAAEVAGVDKERVRGWERRGHLERAGLDEDGLPLYRAVDLAKVKHKFDTFTRAASPAG